MRRSRPGTTPTDTRPATTTPATPSRGRTALLIGAGALVAAAVTAAVALGLGTASSATPAAAPAAVPSATTGGSGHHYTPVNPAKPSAAIEKLQSELGQLNYDDAAPTGIMDARTIAAIKDLQRDANLPQTGTMNAATTAALANFLAHGNNQMGG